MASATSARAWSSSSPATADECWGWPTGLEPAGFEIFDVADPGTPRSVVFFDASGPHSRGVHHLWFVDGASVYMAGGAARPPPQEA